MKKKKECNAEHEDENGRVGCTRPLGHRGPHIATCEPEGYPVEDNEDIALIWDEKKTYDEETYDWLPLIKEDKASKQ